VDVKIDTQGIPYSKLNADTRAFLNGCGKVFETENPPPHVTPVYEVCGNTARPVIGYGLTEMKRFRVNRGIRALEHIFYGGAIVHILVSLGNNTEGYGLVAVFDEREDKCHYKPCGGCQEYGESFLETACREVLREELIMLTIDDRLIQIENVHTQADTDTQRAFCERYWTLNPEPVTIPTPIEYVGRYINPIDHAIEGVFEIDLRAADLATIHVREGDFKGDSFFHPVVHLMHPQNNRCVGYFNDRAGFIVAAYSDACKLHPAFDMYRKYK